jgi:hypothetical protein
VVEGEAVTPTVEPEQTTAGITPATPVEATGSAEAVAAPAGPAADLEKVRELVLKANPDVVPELVRGASLDELIASVEPARSAYQRIAEQVGEATTVSAQPGATVNVQGESTVVAEPPAVPAGGANLVIDPANIPPVGKIAQGLRAKRS